MADLFSIIFLKIASSAKSLVYFNAHLASIWASAALRTCSLINDANAPVVTFREPWL